MRWLRIKTLGTCGAAVRNALALTRGSPGFCMLPTCCSRTLATCADRVPLPQVQMTTQALALPQLWLPLTALLR